MAFENSQGISRICMSRRFRAYCPLGKKWYSANVNIIVDNPTMIPDYCDVDRQIEELDGYNVIIEDAVSKIYQVIVDNCESASQFLVRCEVSDAAHMPVVVEKRGDE